MHDLNTRLENLIPTFQGMIERHERDASELEDRQRRMGVNGDAAGFYDARIARARQLARRNRERIAAAKEGMLLVGQAEFADPDWTQKTAEAYLQAVREGRTRLADAQDVSTALKTEV